jgi:hypothetical protein
VIYDRVANPSTLGAASKEGRPACFHGHLRLPVANRSPPNSSLNACRVLRLRKAEHYEAEIIAAQGLRELRRRQGGSSAEYYVTVFETPHLFGRKRHMMRPIALEIAAGDFALAAGHRRIAPQGLANPVVRLVTVAGRTDQH